LILFHYYTFKIYLHTKIYLHISTYLLVIDIINLFGIESWFTPSGGKNIGIRKSEFVTKTKFLCFNIFLLCSFNVLMFKKLSFHSWLKSSQFTKRYRCLITDVQGYPKKNELKRRLYGINTVCISLYSGFHVNCECVSFFVQSLKRPKKRVIHCIILSLTTKRHLKSD